MENCDGFKMWSDLKGRLDYKTDHEKKVIAEMTRMVNTIFFFHKISGKVTPC